MSQEFKLIIEIVGGITAILGLALIISSTYVRVKKTEAELKQQINELKVKEPCAQRFIELENNSAEQHDKMLILERTLPEILRRIEQLEKVTEKNGEMIHTILLAIPKRTRNGKIERSK
jgi:hypothetical protein